MLSSYFRKTNTFFAVYKNLLFIFLLLLPLTLYYLYFSTFQWCVPLCGIRSCWLLLFRIVIAIPSVLPSFSMFPCMSLSYSSTVSFSDSYFSLFLRVAVSFFAIFVLLVHCVLLRLFLRLLYQSLSQSRSLLICNFCPSRPLSPSQTLISVSFSESQSLSLQFFSFSSTVSFSDSYFSLFLSLFLNRFLSLFLSSSPCLSQHLSQFLSQSLSPFF